MSLWSGTSRLFSGVSGGLSTAAVGKKSDLSTKDNGLSQFIKGHVSETASTVSASQSVNGFVASTGEPISLEPFRQQVAQGLVHPMTCAEAARLEQQCEEKIAAFAAAQAYQSQGETSALSDPLMTSESGSGQEKTPVISADDPRFSNTITAKDFAKLREEAETNSDEEEKKKKLLEELAAQQEKDLQGGWSNVPPPQQSA